MGDFAKLVTEAAAAIEALIPDEPAATLGTHAAGRRHDRYAGGSAAQQALREFSALRAERLLGALELAVARLDLVAPAELISALAPPPRNAAFGFMSMSERSAMALPMAAVDAAHPGASDLILGHVRALLPDISDTEGDEQAIAVKRGASHLAVAVVVSRAVLNAIGTPAATDPAAAIGIAIGTCAEILPGLPMPPAYERAMRDKRRREFQPTSWQTEAMVFGHQFVVVEEPSLTEADFSATGLVAAIDTGFAVRTGVEDGKVPVSVQVVLDEPRLPDLAQWDEVAEISYTAVAGAARFGHGSTAPWPGEFRVRVCATGRDEGEERYELTLWPAPATDPLVHRKTDRVGHLLRGEPAPLPISRPERPYQWLEEDLGPAATVTIVTNAGVADVVDEFEEDSIAVAIDGGVLVVELNNYQGSRVAVLQRLSRNGKAASYHWNANRVTRLSFARDGQLTDDADTRKALEGLNFSDLRHLDAKGITAVVRFTGTVIPETVRELVSSSAG
ncbi:hypothetical protein GCM10011609_66480 [Lentzea pudingi]|uniref:Uncharacterized protein n=1 Tax=Lentzea pudingi TaxID=1789439 RepID=A0ABQ2IM31_9PSEU|nr:DUF6461 domain-containing protein [Lentzea pudingi]GGN16356.1 hypothetical protein GCM10011609_66480 [Lentzea pudingi]